jgi:hypothetical protein
MDVLRRFSAHNRNVSDKANANNYAPTAFAREDATARPDRGSRPTPFNEAMSVMLLRTGG